MQFPSNEAADTLTAVIQSGAATPITVASVTSNPFNVTTNYIWLVDNTGALNKVSEGGMSAATDAATSGTAALGGVAFDNAGNTWSVTSADNVLAFTNYANTTSTTYTGGGLSVPVAVAVDGAGYVWVADAGNNSIAEFTNAGSALSVGGTGYNGMVQVSGSGTVQDFATPSALVLDNAGGVWVANRSGNSVTHVFGAAAPVTVPLSQAVAGAVLGARP